MKKRIYAAVIAVLLMFALPIQILAEEELTHVVDEADLLTDAEEAELQEKLSEISDRQAMDTVVVTVNSLGGKTVVDYADVYFMENGYGYGDDRDGILLLVSMEDRDWCISTHGFGITAFTDAGLDYMEEKFRPLLTDGEYAKSFLTFAELCDDFMTQANKGEPYDSGNLPKEGVSPVWIFGDLGIGLLIALIIALGKKSKLKTVRRKPAAMDYMVPGSQAMTGNMDHLVNRFTTTRRIERDSDSSGSSTHTSSSGSTHGGSSGKF